MKPSDKRLTELRDELIVLRSILETHGENKETIQKVNEAIKSIDQKEEDRDRFRTKIQIVKYALIAMLG